jgi:hypothetical protein
MAFADDYEWSSNNHVLVGANTASTGDVYRVAGALPGGTSTAFDLNVGGSGTQNTLVHSLAVMGNISEAEVLVGRKDSTTIKRCTDPTTSTITWRSSTKSPSGSTSAPNTIVMWSPTSDTGYAATSGSHSGLFTTADGGANWDGLSLLEISAQGNMWMVDMVAADTNNMFLLLQDDGSSRKEQLFKTTDGGDSWMRVWADEGMAYLAASPEYATDSTLFVGEIGTRVWKTSNGGESFVGLTAPADLTAIAAVDGSTYYTGHSANFYKSGRWSPATGVQGNVRSIVIAPDGTIYIGNDGGTCQKSMDDGKNFIPVGPGGSIGSSGNVWLALDPGSSDKLYAGADDGIYTFKDGVDSLWTKFQSLSDDCTGVVLSPDGTLYAGSSYGDDGVYRSVSPAGPPPDIEPHCMAKDLPSGAEVEDITVVSGSNVVYVIISDVERGKFDLGPGSSNAFLVYSWEDPLAVALEQSSPKNGSTVPSPSADLKIKALGIPALSYEFWYADNPDFDDKKTITDIEGSVGTTVELKAGKVYYWKARVEKSGPSAMYSKWSAVWTVTRALSETGTSSTVTSPAPGATGVSLTPTFQWDSVPGAMSYELELADNPFYANSQVKKPLSHNVWTWDVPLEYNTTYYWRVRAVGADASGPWSEGAFTTMAMVVDEPDQIIVPAPEQPDVIVNVPEAPAPTAVIPGGYLLAIIIIGAVLVIAVIVLIVRTRRVP